MRTGIDSPRCFADARVSKKSIGVGCRIAVAVLVVATGLFRLAGRNGKIGGDASRRHLVNPSSVLLNNNNNTTRHLGRSDSVQPIQDILVHYKRDAACPTGYQPLQGSRQLDDFETQLPADLNAGTNGSPVTLCYKRGKENPIVEINFYSSRQRLPSCKDQDMQPVLDLDSQLPADLNKGAYSTLLLIPVREYIAMCYRRVGQSGRSPLYQLRLIHNRPWIPPGFRISLQDLNENVGGTPLFLAYNQKSSPLKSSMRTAAIALAGTDQVPVSALPWSEAVEDDHNITVTFRYHCEKDGGQFHFCNGNTDLDANEFARLCRLAMNGVAEFWSGPVTLEGVTRQLHVRVVAAAAAADGLTADICARGEAFGDGSSYKRSFNVLQMTIWYNRGHFATQELADERFKFVAAHEFGHSILSASYGLVHTANHKGTSTILSENFENTPLCSEVAVLDLMKYYVGSCPTKRYEVTNWGRAKVLMTAGKYTLI